MFRICSRPRGARWSASSLLASTALAFATILAAAPAKAQTIDFDGNSIVVDQLTPPGGRCVPQFANTVSFGPGDIVSTGASNLGTTTETASFCVNSQPPTDIIDGQFTIRFRAGDSITGTFDGRAESTATPGVFAATRNLVVTGGTGRFVGASGAITSLGQLSVAMGVATTTGTVDGTITASTATTTGNFATATGAPSAALGDYATAYGAFAIANGERTAALGSFAEATAAGAVAVGDQAIASGTGAFAAGQGAQATMDFAMALGSNAQATNVRATAIGRSAQASGLNALAVGIAARATGMGASAVGNGAVATNLGATSVGVLANAAGANATAIGRRTSAQGLSSAALGDSAQAANALSVAVGSDARATNDGSIAMGAGTRSSGANSAAFGTGASATFAGSTAIGTAAATTAANQVSLGGSGSSVRVGDIAASTAAQSGSVVVATVDSGGTLGQNTTLIPAVAALQSSSAAQAGQLSTLAAAGIALSGRVDTLFDLRDLDRRDMRQGIAAAVAIGQAPMPSAPGRTSYVLNGADFRGEHAIGGSILHRLGGANPLAIGGGFSFGGNKNNAFKLGIAGEF